MAIRMKLAPIILVSAIGLSGCGYQVSQEDVDKLVEVPAKEWVKYTDNCMNVHKLLKEGKHQEAQSNLEKYLNEQLIEGAYNKGELKVTNKVSKSASEKNVKTIEVQIDKIQTYLK